MPGSFNNGAGFSFSDYFWIPIIGPLFGGCVGAIVYDFFIGDVLHARKSRTALEAPREPGRAEPNVSPDRV
jgi:glycerol uptake facilitator protein